MFRSATFLRLLVICGIAFSALAFAKASRNSTSVTYPSGFASSQRLSEMPIDLSMFPGREMPEPRQTRKTTHGPGAPDSALQTQTLPAVSATKGIDFEGVGVNGWAPSDNNLAVGPNHIVETVNVQIGVYSKSGTLLSGPTNLMTLFTALGGNCVALIVDPIVLYDRPADRWLVSGIGIGSTYSECVAVSKTNDPAGAYTLYSYDFGANLNDYPKLGVWPTASNSAYLATYNMFGGISGANLCGFDRTKMLAGSASAAQLCKLAPEYSYLPSDNDGPTPPADGTPGLFITWQSSAPGQLYLRKLTLNFTSGTSSLSAPTAISVADFTPACFSSCVPQLGTTQMLDSLGDRPMYRFPVRHFADHDRAVLNHSVLNGSQVAVRWYELFDPAGSVTVSQQGTYAPDTTYRWMGSIAEDKNGDIAVGYSASSTSLHPAIRFTGRVPTDTPGTLESEISILEGAGSQTTGLSRWGDYSALQVDPTDDCTFWYVDQYEANSGTFNWNTRIGSFAFNGCSGNGGPAVSLTPTSLKWGKVLVGTTASGKKKVTLTNTGSATLSVTTIGATGDFALVPVKATKKITPCTNGGAVAPGASCVVKVSFSPTQTGLRTGSLTFTDNAPDSPQNVALTGTGK